MQNKNKKAFTLIELLIVIAIIGILAVALLPSIMDAPKAARDAGRKAQVNDLLIAIESYKATGGQLPGGTVKGGGCIHNDSLAGVSKTFVDNIKPLLKGSNISVTSPEKGIKIGQNSNELSEESDCPFYYYQLDEPDNKGNQYYICGALEGSSTGPNFATISSVGAEPSLDASFATNNYCIVR